MNITDKDNYEDMMEYVDMRLISDINSKENRKEVVIPLSLINGNQKTNKLELTGGVNSDVKRIHKKGMLDHLPNNVWSNPELKWLDPANGIGNFPICVYYRLMRGLKDVDGYTDTATRSRHIITKMLYMIELDEMNVEISKSLFCGSDSQGSYSGNIYQGSFLQDNLIEIINKTIKKKDDKWPEKFDVIMGNPPWPYRSGGSDIWGEFVIGSIELLKSDGYLVFVTPIGWRKPESKESIYNGLFKLMTQDNYMKYLEVHNNKNNLDVFKAGNRFDIYIIQKTKYILKTTVLDQLGNFNELDLSQWTFLPNFDYDIVVNLLAHNEQERCKHKIDVLYESSKYEARKDWTIEDVIKNKNKSKYSDFKYPLVHSTPKGGHRFYYSNIIKTYKGDKKELRNTPPELVGKKVFFGIPKVIFGDSGIYDAIIDMNGEYGMTQHAIGLRVNNKQEGELVKQALESDIFKKILEACSYSNFQIDWRLFTYFKKDWYNTVLELERNSKQLPPKSKPTTPKPQQGGSNSNNNKQIIKSYIKQYGSAIQNVYNNTRSNSLHNTSKSDRNAVYGIVNKIQSIVGGSKKTRPMTEENFTSLVKNITDSGYLKQIIKNKQLGGETPSKRIRPLYKEYYNSLCR